MQTGFSNMLWIFLWKFQVLFKKLEEDEVSIQQDVRGGHGKNAMKTFLEVRRAVTETFKSIFNHFSACMMYWVHHESDSPRACLTYVLSMSRFWKPDQKKTLWHVGPVCTEGLVTISYQSSRNFTPIFLLKLALSLSTILFLSCGENVRWVQAFSKICL